jgi:hypothetical protein
MNSENKDFPSSSIDLIPALPAPQTGSPASGEIEFTAEDYKTALRMLVGAALEGSDELRKQIKTRLTAIQKVEQEIDASMLEDETGGIPLLYTFIGLLFKTPKYLSWGTSTADRAYSRAASFVSRFTEPITNSRALRPVWQRYDDLVARGESAVSSLEKIGRSEAPPSRALIRQQVSDETIEGLLIYVVEKSKIREMIVETSAEVGGDAMIEIRGRSASVDSSLDNLVDNILRRKKLNPPPSDSLS